MTEQCDALVVGAGPAGLMAASELAQAGYSVTIAEAKPSVARKFLMAGKSGLNLTKDESLDVLMQAYGDRRDWLHPMIAEFDANGVQDWARDLGCALFTGSSGRVFPTVMKASPLLRAWLARLDGLSVQVCTRWRWTGWQDGQPVFETADGPVQVSARVVVLALGGCSWARLGSDGRWTDCLMARGVSLQPFKPANAGLLVEWSTHMAPFLGHPLKGIALHAGGIIARGEAVISERGLEGGGVYAVCAAVRDGADLAIDLLPDVPVQEVASRLTRARGKASWSNHLRKQLKLTGARSAVLQEFGRPLPADPKAMAALAKALPVPHLGLRPMDEAISTAGGVPATELDDRLMLRKLPGVFCAGEMLDWEAPTGGYLLTACLATGRWAGRGAVAYLASAATR